MELDGDGQTNIVLLRNTVRVRGFKKLFSRSSCPWHAIALVARHDCSRCGTWFLDKKLSDNQETGFRLRIYSAWRRGWVPTLVLLPTSNCLHFLRDRLRTLCRPSSGLLRETVLGRPALAAEEDDRCWNFRPIDCPKFPLLLADLQRLGSALQPMELQNVAAFLGLIRTIPCDDVQPFSILSMCNGEDFK